jgi:hypothetical protein
MPGALMMILTCVDRQVLESYGACPDQEHGQHQHQQALRERELDQSG